jgi:hypothetical protein
VFSLVTERVPHEQHCKLGALRPEDGDID